MLACAHLFVFALISAALAAPLLPRGPASMAPYRCPVTDASNSTLTDLRTMDATTMKCFYGASSDGTAVDYCIYNSQTGAKLADNDGGHCHAGADASNQAPVVPGAAA